MNELLTPMVQIRNQSLVIYNRYNGSRKKSIMQKVGLGLSNIKKYTGTITPGARKRIAKAINLLIASSENKVIFNPVTNKNFNFRLAFITLTIPDNSSITTKEAHKLLLEPFIKWLRQNHGLKNYVWKLEVQKRGQIHYHLTADCFVHYQELRNKWNRLIERASLMQDFKDKFGHNNPNSTDIHKVKKIKDLSAYLIKYFTKSDQNETGLAGKIWDCSLSLKKANYYSTELTQDIEYDIYKNQVEKRCVIDYCDKFSIIKFNKIEPISIMPKEVKEAYYKNLRDIRSFQRNLFECPKKSNKIKDSVLNDIHNIVSAPVKLRQYDLFYN